MVFLILFLLSTSYLVLGAWEQDFWSCDSGLKLLPSRYYNDDFCDCGDASDEPFTSACSNGAFNCTNLGYKSKLIWSGEDCCDGSDEAPGICPDICKQLGDAALNRLKDELYKFYTGLQIKLSDLNKVARVYLEHIQELEDIEANYANIEAAYELAKGYKTLLSEYLDYDLDNIEHACELVDKLENDKHEVSSRIKQLKDIFSKDFGPNNEFFLLVDECVQHKQGLYTYEVCFFKEATQSERGNRVNIGKFDKFDDNYRTIYFTNGTKCPNGVSRSLKISLECSDEMKVLSVTEPHICEYSMGMTSPYVCSEEYIQEYIRNHS